MEEKNTLIKPLLEELLNGYPANNLPEETYEKIKFIIKEINESTDKADFEKRALEWSPIVLSFFEFIYKMLFEGSS